MFAVEIKSWPQRGDAGGVDGGMAPEIMGFNVVNMACLCNAGCLVEVTEVGA